MNKYPSSVFLFDIDGVLVEPRGYRQAMSSTLKWLFPQPEVEALLPTEQEHSLFESLQITSEWDMVAICSVLIASEIMRANPTIEYPADLYQWRSLQFPHVPKKLDYQIILPKIAGSLPAAENPSAAFHAYLIERPPASSVFEWPDMISPILSGVLLATRNIADSSTSALFQNFVLGAQEFQSCYKTHPIVSCESLLLKCDRPLISPTAVRELRELSDLGRVRLAAMTARPSHYPPTAINPICSPPEAEMALKLVGLNFIPVVGLGALEYAAVNCYVSRKNLLKPAPFHALSALLGALGFSDLEAIRAAAEITQNQQSYLAQLIPEDLTVVLFEDTAVGVRSINQAASLLVQLGKKLRVHNCGISQQPEKISSLEKAGAQIFPSTEFALQAALHAFL